MKKLKKQFNTITLFFVVVMLIQSCTVYKSTPITLDQAVQSGAKVRVKTLDNEKFKFKKIEFIDGKFQGLKKQSGFMVKTPLNQEDIKSVNEKNKTLSTVLSIGIPVVTVGGLLAIAAASCCAIGFSGPLYFPQY